MHPHLEEILKGHTCKVETFGLSEGVDLRAENLELVGRPGYLGIRYMVTGKLNFDVEVDIPGKFSVYNSLTAIAICRHFNVETEMIQKALKAANVKGRVEKVKVSDDFTLMIDYAHNAMALESLLTTLKDIIQSGSSACLDVAATAQSCAAMRWVRCRDGLRILRSSRRTIRAMRSRTTSSQTSWSA